MKPEIQSSWRSECGRYTVDLERACFDEMVRLGREHFPREVGTAIVGSYSDDGSSARVTGLTPLTTDSRGARTTFYRGVRGLFEFCRDVFRSSGGLVHYVGEWHSHPGGTPDPSGTDDANAMANARDQETRCAECILVILGVNEQDATCRVFVYSRDRGRIDLVLERKPVEGRQGLP
jgi:integrative and conjugative element protein (TIGR02256 family)